MERFGFNINYKMSPEHICELGEKCLGTGLYQAIEITYYEHMEHLDTTAYNQAIRTIIQKYAPQVLVHISAFNLAEENHVIRQAVYSEIEHCILYTAALGGREVVIHSGDSRAAIHVPIIKQTNQETDDFAGGIEEIYEKAWGLSVEMMQKACDTAKKYGVTLYTENLFGGQLTETTEILRKYLKDVNRDNLKIVFDVGHGHYLGHDPYTEVIHAGEQLKHLHIHDNHGIGQGGPKDEHLPVGEGNVDFAGFVKGLQEVHYQGLYMMELKYCTVENLKQSRERILSNLEATR